MANGNGNKSLWIVFWIFAVIVFPSLFAIGNNMIANDKKYMENFLNNRNLIAELTKETNNKIEKNQIEILQRLTKIETVLRIK